MESKVKEIMSAIFEVDILTIDNSSSPDTIEKWDSLGHMNLVTSLEDELGIIFEDHHIEEMLNFGLIMEVLKEVTSDR